VTKDVRLLVALQSESLKQEMDMPAWRPWSTPLDLLYQINTLWNKSHFLKNNHVVLQRLYSVLPRSRNTFSM